MITSLVTDIWTKYEIIGLLEQAKDKEMCGLLTGVVYPEGRAFADKYWAIDNISPTPEVNFIFEPNQYFNILKSTRLFDPKNYQMLCAFVHSHPKSLPIPSETDTKNMMEVGFQIGYLIYSYILNDFGCYYWNGNKFLPLDWTLTYT